MESGDPGSPTIDYEQEYASQSWGTLAALQLIMNKGMHNEGGIMVALHLIMNKNMHHGVGGLRQSYN